MNGEDYSSGGSEEGIRVFVRIRPLNKREIADKQTIGWDFNSTSLLEDTQNGQRVYAFDRCYNPDENNKTVYELVGKPVILKAMEGYNGTVFTYGQTGSGKTFTMRGCDDDPGMMILCINDIFDFIEMNKKKAKYTLKIAYMEVYNEEINDLLGEGPASKNLRIVSDDSIKGAVIGNLTEVMVDDPLKMLEVLRKGETSRSYGSTTMNAESSRSHTIYRISIESVEIDQDSDPAEAKWGNKGELVGVKRLSFMNLVDLAGSERQKSTNASGKTLKEGANINKSLLALGAVINKLGEASKKAKGGKAVFLPYRDSKLTRILKQSLGGNTMTSILCTITPAPMHREETVSTLKFGQLCKTIKNTVKSNEVVDDRMLIKQYKSTIQELRLQVNKLEDEVADSSAAEDRARVISLEQDKKELASKVKSLEVLVMRGTNALEEASEKTVSSAELDEVNAALRASHEANIALQNELNAAKKKTRQLNAEIIDLEQIQASLEADVGSLDNFEEMKNTFEEYQQQVQAQIDDDRAKMAAEKESLQAERALTMAERTHLDEKEGRLGLLTAALDERESRLRHHLNTLQEQEGNWQQSIEALTRREELAAEWQNNHRSREKKIQDWDDQLKKKFADLSKREADLVEAEHAFKTQKRELGEREQRLVVALSRVAHTEQAVSSLEEKLSVQENALKVRDTEMSIKERERELRARELDQLENIIAEKDRKVKIEQRHVEEREDLVRAQEEKVRKNEEKLDKELFEVRQRESDMKIMKEKYTAQMHELETRESMCAEQIKNANNLSGTLNIKEAQLQRKEARLNELEIKLKDTNIKTEELNQRVLDHEKAVDKFFNHDVAQISSRHAKELRELEELIEQQLRSVANFQTELEKIKETNARITLEKDNLAEELSIKSGVIQEMEEEMARLEEERETLRQEAEEERKQLKLLSKESNGHGSPRQNHESSEEAGALGGFSDQLDTSGGGAFGKIANRSFLVQLAETQAILKAVLQAQTSSSPSISFLGSGVNQASSALDVSGSSGDKGRTSRNDRHRSSGSSGGGGGVSLGGIGTSTGVGEYPQPSREDIQQMLFSNVNQEVSPPPDVQSQTSQSPHANGRSKHFPFTPLVSAESGASHSQRESKPEYTADRQQLQSSQAHGEKSSQRQQQFQQRTPTSYISENALKKLSGGDPGSSRGHSRGGNYSSPRSSPGPPQGRKSKFEVISRQSSGGVGSSYTPTRDRDGVYTSNISASAHGSSPAHGNTPVVSVELSLNRSGNTSGSRGRAPAGGEGRGGSTRR